MRYVLRMQRQHTLRMLAKERKQAGERRVIMNCQYCKADCVHKGEQQEKECRGYIPQTNADRIRAMSDEELAQVFGHNTICTYIQDEFKWYCDKRESCSGCIKEWLKQPVEGE